MPSVWVNVPLSGADGRLDDIQLLDAIVMAVENRRATISDQSDMKKRTHCVSIEVKGNNLASYYSAAEAVVLQWLRDVHHDGQGLPFERKRVFGRG